jgi:aminotransferase EvaB
VVRTAQRDALRAHLQECGVATDVHYPIADFRQPAIAESHAGVQLPVTEAACATVMSLPCFPGLSEPDVEQVIQSVCGFFNRDGA